MSVRAEAQPHPGTLQLIPQEALAGATAMQQSPPSVAEQGELHEANSAQLEESNLSQPVFFTVPVLAVRSLPDRLRRPPPLEDGGGHHSGVAQRPVVRFEQML